MTVEAGSEQEDGKIVHRKSEQIAAEIWNDVLTNMPEEFHRGRALVEARRRLIDIPDQDGLAEALDALAVKAFGPDQIGDLRPPSQKAPSPIVPTESKMRDWVIAAVGDGFSATTDGSAERAEVLKQRALGNAERVIEEHSKSLSWFARRRLRKLARETADEEVKAVLL